jgi:hypothetical protein
VSILDDTEKCEECGSTDTVFMEPGFFCSNHADVWAQKYTALGRIEAKLDNVMEFVEMGKVLAQRVSGILDDTDVKAFIHRIESAPFFGMIFPKVKNKK